MVSVPLEGAAGPFQGVGLLATLAAGGGLCCESGKRGIRSACCRFGLRVGDERVCAVIKSLWALVSGHWSASQAARVEVQQQTEAKALEDDPIEERVGVGVGGCGDCVAVGCSFCGWFG